jgi:hypothetical protein
VVIGVTIATMLPENIKGAPREISLP